MDTITRDTYVEKIIAEKDKLDAELRSKYADAKLKAHEEWLNFEQAKKDWELQFESFKVAAEDKWEDAKNSLDTAWKQVGISFERLKNKLGL